MMSSRWNPLSIFKRVVRRLRGALQRHFGPRVESVRDRADRDIPGLFKPGLPQDADDLLRHFATRVSDGWPRLPDELTDLRLDLSRMTDEEVIGKADAALDGDLHPSGVKPEFTEKGAIDWSFNPAESKEWLLMLHRHAWWPLWGAAYQRTGDEKYAEAFVAQLLDWINTNPMPGQKNEGAASWRLMETGLRMRISWIPCFGCFFDSPAFDRAAKLIMLKVICDHGRFLHRFHTNRNHLVRESNGLLATGLCFHEFDEAQAWVSAAAGRLESELHCQVNRDGSHLEMSVGYQWLTVVEFEVTRSLLRQFGQTTVINDLDKMLRQMYEFLAAVIRPDRTFPQLNDGFILWDAERLGEIANVSGWHDIEYIASGGSVGSEPDFCSQSFPNAGFHIMRSDWGNDARYLIADTGPYGGPHGHEDKLSFEAFAYGAPFIVDPGSYTYDSRDKFRDYFVGSSGHNTVLVDGKSQIRRWVDSHMVPAVHDTSHGWWASNDVCDFASGQYDEGYADFTLLRPASVSPERDVVHRRDFVFAKPDYWVIVDHLSATRMHDYSFLFHLAPDVVVDNRDGTSAILRSKANDARMVLKALIDNDIEITVVVGEESPIQGWYSPDHHRKCPAPAVEFKVSGASTLRVPWLLFPLPAGEDPANVRVISSQSESAQGNEFVISHDQKRDTFRVDANVLIQRHNGRTWSSKDPTIR
jgi:uncharacterized heparinase superfamily protein